MSSVTRYAGLTDDQLEMLHRICYQFEQALRNNEFVSIEGQIETAHEDIQSSLFCELLEIELEALKAIEGLPEIATYEARFPNRLDQVRLAFAEIFGKQLEPETPAQIGRYRVERLLGSGGFANVYLGYDEDLKRSVAIKVPLRSLILRRQDAVNYLDEAQALASLDHPHIVPVHDVGRNDEFPCYVVSKHIAGTDLRRHLKKNRLSWRASAELVANIADALHHAHTRGLVHRDVKPGNILLDQQRYAYLADFGVALNDVDVAGGPRFAGTPAYMSPEQARGEGHRVDGRSDIYSLGAVFYELLTGRRTFPGKSRLEVLERIAHHDPKPPRQIEDSVPRELERICLKALAKRARERYTTALDMAEELHQFLDQCDSDPSTPAAILAALTDSGIGSEDCPRSTPSDSDSQPIRIIPRGLRAFDEHDSEFFLRLLPGPRDREGLSESISFWKTRVEETDPDKTFQIGLIYGPSGCGKSSLMRAGLIPTLADGLTVVYVEATSSQTETRILQGLRKHRPDLKRDLSLKDTLVSLRRRPSATQEKKVLIVVDQFEQWLHAKSEENNTQLVAALRQCDGSRVQCILLVRDDFWLAVSRFMGDLEIDLVQGNNIALTDLFDRDHAKKVLTAFGQAFGKLPEAKNEIHQEQQDFINQAVDGLAVGGKVICIRLALFAEMMKGKTWTQASLKVVGGMEGVGVTFLEETFSAPSANPSHRRHQRAARAVLNALLPETGIDIKGQMRSSSELLEASGYGDRPSDFDQLVRILDSELRLITPTEAEPLAGDDWQRDADEESAEDRLTDRRPVGSRRTSDTGNSPTTTRYYQLTHDYLVHSLRDWLTRKQKETRRGRTELRLSERSALWNAIPENRNLPSAGEWAAIRSFTNKKNWTSPQRKMMQTANRVHGLRWSIGLATLVIIAISVQQFASSVRHRSLVERMKTAVETMANSHGVIVPRAIEDLEDYPTRMVIQELNSRFYEVKESQKLALACALSHFDSVKVDFLVEQINQAPPSEAANFATALANSRECSLNAIHRAAAVSHTSADWQSKHRLAVVALYLGDESLARDMCELNPDRVERIKFILGWTTWQGDLTKLARIASTIQDPNLRSGICAGIGGMRPEDVTSDAKEAWTPVLSDWFQNEPAAAVHSAAGWVLSQWKLETPAISCTRDPEKGRAWYLNSAGMTMLKIPGGSFTRRCGRSSENPRMAIFLQAPIQTVTLSHSFLMSDREISVGEFQQMMNDPDYDDREKSDRWPGPNPIYSPTINHPVSAVNWNDAVKFCNWLSQKEGLSPCYERTGHIWKIPTGNFEEWKTLDGANGYRLPTEAEWEYACRAGNMTQDPFGDEVNSLLLSVFVSGRSRIVSTFGGGFNMEKCGAKTPNAWGFFDLQGNAYEWCHDWSERYYGLEENRVDDAVVDPKGPAKNSGLLERVYRDGIFFRRGLPLSMGEAIHGFRVVRTIGD